jgi:hypothetical protein
MTAAFVCCNLPRDTKYCCDCGKMIPEIPLSTRVRDFLKGKFCPEKYQHEMFMDESNNNKSRHLNKEYIEYRYTLHSDNKYYVRLRSCYKESKESKNGTVTHYPTHNSILEDMKVPYFHPYADASVEDMIVGFTKKKLSKPTYLKFLTCDEEFGKYKITISGKCTYKDKNREKWSQKQQSLCDKMISDMTKMTHNLFMLNDKLYVLDDLNEKYCKNSGLSIDWKKCVEYIHRIKDLQVHILRDDINVLLNRIEENNKIRELLSLVSLSDKNINDKNINDKNINDKNVNDKSNNDKSNNDSSDDKKNLSVITKIITTKTTKENLEDEVITKTQNKPDVTNEEHEKNDKIEQILDICLNQIVQIN